MPFRSNILAVIIGSLCAAAGAHAQSGVINPLYAFGDEKLCPIPGVAAGVVELANCKASHGPIDLDRRDILTVLLERYPIVPKNRQQYAMTPDELLLARLVPVNCGTDKKACAAPVITTAEARFEDDENALLFRRSLLRVFEAAYSGGAAGFYVRPNVGSKLRGAPDAPERACSKATNTTQTKSGETNMKTQDKCVDVSKALQPIYDEVFNNITKRKDAEEICPDFAGADASWDAFFGCYRPLNNPLDDDMMISMFLAGDAPFIVSFGAPDLTDLKRFPAVSSKSAPVTSALFPPRSTNKDARVASNSKDTKDKSFERNWILTKNAAEFAKRKPDGAEFGSEFDLGDGGDDASVTAEAAIGYRFKRDFDRKGGDKFAFAITPHVSIRQAPTKIKVFPDEKDLTFNANGEPQPVSKEIAFATLFAGVRADLEFKSKDWAPQNLGELAEIDNDKREALAKSGLAPIDHKMSLTLGAFTDNYFDQQGSQIAVGWSPGSNGFVPGYRRPTRLSFGRREGQSSVDGGLDLGDWLRSGYFEFDAELVVDHVEYGRSPRDFSKVNASVREVSPDATRYGVDAETSFQWKNIFSPSTDDARVEIGASYQLRRDFDDPDDDLSNYSVHIKFLDVLAEKYDIGFEYSDGADILTTEESESFNFTLELGF